MHFSDKSPVSQNCKHANRGFTLIELLAVVSIIAVLMALIMGAARFARIKAMEGRAKSDLQHLANALSEYQLRFRTFPTLLDDPEVTVNLPPNVDTKDPWDRPYVYQASADTLSYSLHSEGRRTGQPSDDIHLGK